MPNLTEVLGADNTEKPTPPVPVSQTGSDGLFTAEEFISHVNQLELISVDASQSVRRKWDISWGLYNNSYDFAGKANWQSKNYIPRLNMTVRAATFMVKRGLVGPTKPFSIDGVGEFGKAVAPYVQSLTMQHLEEDKYVTKVTDSLHAALLSNLMVLKVYPVYVDAESVYFADPTPKPVPNCDGPVKTKKYKKLQIRIDAVDPYHVHLDPTGQNKFIIHNIDMDLYDLVSLASDPKNGFEKSEVDKICEDYSKINIDGTSEQEDRSGQSKEATMRRRARNVSLQEFWGDVWSSDGKLIARNCTYVVANKKYLVKRPVKNKLPDHLPPFIIAPVVRKPFSVWHQGFAEVVAGLQIMMTELINLTMDANQFSSAKAFEVDIDMVYDPIEFSNGIYPGKVFKKRGGGFNTAPMIKEIEIGSVTQQSMGIFQMLDREFQNGCGLNEYAMPTSSSKNRVTATEVLEKSQSASSFMEDLAGTVEETCMEPMLEKIFHLIVEYRLNFDDPETLEILGPERAAKLAVFMMNPAFRNALHRAPLKFHARGISATVKKLRELEKLGQFGKMIQAYPELQAQIDPKKMLHKALEAFGWYSEDVLKDVQDLMIENPTSNQVDKLVMPIGGMSSVFAPNAYNGMRQVPNSGF